MSRGGARRSRRSLGDVSPTVPSWLETAIWTRLSRAVSSQTRRRAPRVSPEPDHPHPRHQLPVLGRFLPAPVAAKVPEVILLFWVVKILTTAGGEATSDYLKTFGNFGGGGIEVLVIVVGLALQFGTRRYRAFAYWSLAFAIAITGT